MRNYGESKMKFGITFGNEIRWSVIIDTSDVTLWEILECIEQQFKEEVKWK